MRWLKRISNPDFCGFVWKQASADGKTELAEEYSRNLKQLIPELSEDLGVSDLPTFIPFNASVRELLKGLLPRVGREERLAAKKSAGQDAAAVADMVDGVLTYIDANGSLKDEKPVGKKQRYLATVISEQNRLGREFSHVTSFYFGKLPIEEDGVHYSFKGYLMLGETTATVIEDFYKQ